MASFDAERPEYVAVVCPVCRKRIEARVRQQPGTVECPDCFTQVDVPARETVLAGRPVELQPQDPETYAIVAEPEHPRRSASGGPLRMELACPRCGTSVGAEPGDRARNITCPECLDVIRIPSRDDAQPQRKRRKRPLPPDPAGKADGISPANLPGRPPAPDLLAAEGEIRREPPPPVPAWTFFTRVFSLPWHAEVRTRWICMSIGCCLIGLVCATIHWLVAAGFIIAIPFFALPMVWLVLWTGSFTVSSAMTVVEDTAAGNDVIHHWNDGGWKDWMTDTFGPLFLAAVSGTASYPAALAAAVWAGDGWFWPALGGMFFLLYPIVLLSALQDGSYWSPLTRPVLKSIIRRPWAWGMFYALTALVAAAYVLPVRYGLRGGRWYSTLFLSGPLLSATMLVSARLLGRLGWRALVADARPGDASSLSPRGGQRWKGGKRNSPPLL